MPRFDNCFVYFDPPYFNKGPELYTNFFTYEDHKRISQEIKKINCPWIVTYDNVDKIIELYNGYICKEFDLNYSVANTGKSSEIMFINSNDMWPTQEELINANIRINLKKRSCKNGITDELLQSNKLVSLVQRRILWVGFIRSI